MKPISILMLIILPVCAQRIRTRQSNTTVVTPATPPVNNAPAMAQARTISVGPKDLIPIRLRVGFSTMLILPASDNLIEVSCGDKESWVVNGADNVVHIKPVREGARTNLNVISRSGKYFSFLLNEISREPAHEPDLKLFIEPKDELFVIQRPVAVQAGSAVSDEVAKERSKLHAELETATHRADEEAKRRSDYPYALRFGYRFQSKAPFFIAAVFDDGTTTFIRTESREAGTLYEVDGGKRLLTRFSYRDGLYVATKVLREGCLVLDKKSACFSHGR